VGIPPSGDNHMARYEEEFNNQSDLNKVLTKDLVSLNVKVKTLQYKMDFGTTEVVIKMGLN
jgi:hypothetical protein